MILARWSSHHQCNWVEGSLYILITMILARWCVKSQRWKGNGGRGSASDQYWDYCSPQVIMKFMMTVIICRWFFLLFLSIFKTKGEIVVQPARVFPLSNRRERKCLHYYWWLIQITRLPRWVSSKTHNVTKWVTGCDSGPRGLGRISGPQACPVGT